ARRLPCCGPAGQFILAGLSRSISPRMLGIDHARFPMIRRDSNTQQTLAILVGGGPAPGINGVIASATIEAINCGMRVLGLRDGYRWLAEGDTSHTLELKIADVS